MPVRGLLTRTDADAARVVSEIAIGVEELPASPIFQMFGFDDELAEISELEDDVQTSQNKNRLVNHVTGSLDSGVEKFEIKALALSEKQVDLKQIGVGTPPFGSGSGLALRVVSHLDTGGLLLQKKGGLDFDTECVPSLFKLNDQSDGNLRSRQWGRGRNRGRG